MPTKKPAGNGDRRKQARALLDKVAELGEQMEDAFAALNRLYPGLHLMDLMVAMQVQRRRLTEHARRKMGLEDELSVTEGPILKD